MGEGTFILFDGREAWCNGIKCSHCIDIVHLNLLLCLPATTFFEVTSIAGELRCWYLLVPVGR